MSGKGLEGFGNGFRHDTIHGLVALFFNENRLFGCFLDSLSCKACLTQFTVSMKSRPQENA